MADHQRVYLPRGKMLGGSRSMNAMVYIRGARADYDGWARDGAKGWAYDDLLPYFRRSEANERGEDQFHGKLGPLTVSDGRSRYSLMDAFVEAGVEAGHPRNSDFNGEKQVGVGFYQLTQRDGMRCSAAIAFLHPALGRPNLKVVIRAFALCVGLAAMLGGAAPGVSAEGSSSLRVILDGAEGDHSRA